jgi:hypothetical protein
MEKPGGMIKVLTLGDREVLCFWEPPSEDGEAEEVIPMSYGFFAVPVIQRSEASLRE